MNPITREESLLDGQDLTPITRKEQFIKHIYDPAQTIPEPITREEYFLKKAGEGTSPVQVEELSVTENGTYSETGKAYSPVIVDVPAPTLITKTITENGTYNASEDNADGYSQVTVAVEGFKKKSIANTPTDIASFNDGTANPMPSLEISIEPVQSGSGDPSPSNVRPISGWSGADVTRCGVNLFDKDSVTVSNVTFNGKSEMITRKGFELLLPNGNYSFKCFGATIQDYIFVYKNNAGNYIDVYYLSIESGRWLGANISVDTGDKLYVVAAYTGRTLDLSFDLDIITGTTIPTTYSPYQGSTLSIPFHDNSDNPITVYGGRLNVTSGELTATHANIASYNSETINEPWISSMDAYSAGATPTTGAQVVYPLATPQTYQLTPAQVTTLLGQNNIFADCGQILEGEYFVTL